MAIFEELWIFIRTIINWIYTFIGFSFFFFTFGLKHVMLFGNDYILPLPSDNSFCVQIFNIIRYDVLPQNVQLIVTNPMSAFVSQITLALLLGFLVTVPLFIYSIIMYIIPALLPHEKRTVIWAIIPFTFLFLSGSAFSYFFLVPATFKVLYPFATTLGAVPFFGIDEFIYYVFGLMVAVGVMFLLPIFMVLLSYIGLVEPAFWKSKWRYALLFFLVLSAIITPDGTGVTMIMLFLPLVALYLFGYFFANKLQKHV